MPSVSVIVPVYDVEKTMAAVWTAFWPRPLRIMN